MVFIAVKRDHDHGNPYNVKYLIGLAYYCRGSVHCQHGREHGSLQAVMVRELREIHLAGNQKLTDCHTE